MREPRTTSTIIPTICSTTAIDPMMIAALAFFSCCGSFFFAMIPSAPADTASVMPAMGKSNPAMLSASASFAMLMLLKGFFSSIVPLHGV